MSDFDLTGYEPCKAPTGYESMKITTGTITLSNDPVVIVFVKRPSSRLWCWLSLQLDALLERLGINVGL